jgi:hypothetical protein
MEGGDGHASVKRGHSFDASSRTPRRTTRPGTRTLVSTPIRPRAHHDAPLIGNAPKRAERAAMEGGDAWPGAKRWLSMRDQPTIADRRFPQHSAGIAPHPPW